MYAQHERLEAVQSETQAIGEFLEWLEAQGITLSVENKGEIWGTTRYVPITESDESLLARCFDIDLRALEAEKRDMLTRLPLHGGC